MANRFGQVSFEDLCSTSIPETAQWFQEMMSMCLNMDLPTITSQPYVWKKLKVSAQKWINMHKLCCLQNCVSDDNHDKYRTVYQKPMLTFAFRKNRTRIEEFEEYLYSKNLHILTTNVTASCHHSESLCPIHLTFFSTRENDEFTSEDTWTSTPNHSYGSLEVRLDGLNIFTQPEDWDATQQEYDNIIAEILNVYTIVTIWSPTFQDVNIPRLVIEYFTNR